MKKKEIEMERRWQTFEHFVNAIIATSFYAFLSHSHSLAAPFRISGLLRSFVGNLGNLLRVRPEMAANAIESDQNELKQHKFRFQSTDSRSLLLTSSS